MSYSHGFRYKRNVTNIGHKLHSLRLYCVFYSFLLKLTLGQSYNGGIIITRLKEKGKGKREEKEKLIFTEYHSVFAGQSGTGLTLKLSHLVLSTTAWCKWYPCLTIQETQGCSADD